MDLQNGNGMQKLAEEVRAGRVSLEKIGEERAGRCSAAQEKYNAFIDFEPGLIQKEISALKEKIEAKKELPLAAVSYAVADAICTEEGKTTCASKMLASYQPGFEAAAVTKLREKGAVLAGKANLDEFSLSAAGENSFTGAMKNPRDAKYSAGSGAAAAVAAAAVEFALAPDICGELRQAAAYCAVAALKPTYGRVSRRGLIDSAPSLEQIGIIAANISDLAPVLEAISGHDALDSVSSSRETPPYTDLLQEAAPAPIKVAVPEDWAAAPNLDEGIKEAFQALLPELKQSSINIEITSLPNLSHSLVTATIIRALETFSNLSNYDGVRFGLRAEGAHLQEMYRKTRTEAFGRKLKEFLTFGALVSSGNYYSRVFLRAQKMRTLIIKELEECLRAYDLILLPGTPNQAPLLTNSEEAPMLPLPDYAAFYTAAANLAGLPALTLPIPCPGRGLLTGSVSVQLLGKAWGEARLLQAALHLEKVRIN